MKHLATLIFTCLLLVSCGGSSSNNNIPNESPTATAPDDFSANEAETVNLAGTGTDTDGTISSYSWAQTSGTTVTISNAQTAQASFVAPGITDGSPTTALVFQLQVTDNDGATSTDSVTVTINNITVDPVIVTQTSVTAAENTTVQLDASSSNDPDGTIASYAWTQTSGTNVTLNNATTAIASFDSPDIANPVDTLSFGFQLVITDNEGNTDTESVAVTIVDESAIGVTISGQATFDHVPHTSGNALDYNSITQLPIRGAVVQLLDQSNAVLQTTNTDANGDYSFSLTQSQMVRVRVLAQMAQSGPPTWDFTVIDNTNSGALYVLDGSLTDSGSSGTQTRDLHAASGWGGSSYTSTRAAGPFAILDNIYDAYNKVVASDPDVVFQPLPINWSINNVPTNGDRAQGQIGTSFYSAGSIFILGAANNDTDEYDGHVIIHEWGHYFEDNLTRSDSIGGSHSGDQLLDPRLAFGEGWGNAWSGIVTDDPFYRDSFGSSQSQGFSVNVESNSVTNEGWYNEASVQSIIYDLYDSNNDGSDTISLGFTPIYEALTDFQRNTEGFTSIFSFATYMKNSNAGSVAQINALLSAQSIVGSTIDIYGSTETNNGGDATHVLPVYTQLTVNGAAQQVCSTDSFGVAESFKFNKIGARRFLRVTIPSAGNYRVSATSTTNNGDPDILVSERGVLRSACTNGGTGNTNGCTGTVGSEAVDVNLQSGDHTIEVFDFLNVDDNSTGGSNCFDITIISI